MSSAYQSFATLLLHGGPVTAEHWWLDWQMPILSIIITLVLVGLATAVYLIEKKRLGQERS